MYYPLELQYHLYAFIRISQIRYDLHEFHLVKNGLEFLKDNFLLYYTECFIIIAFPLKDVFLR